jgi:hypothetical protein
MPHFYEKIGGIHRLFDRKKIFEKISPLYPHKIFGKNADPEGKTSIPHEK